MEDTAHIHNHIIFNSTSMDYRGKFRHFLGSGKAVARLNDLICLEQGAFRHRKSQTRRQQLQELAGPPRPALPARPAVRGY